MNRLSIRRGGLVAPILILVLALSTAAQAGGDWNDDGIAWRPFDDGLAEAGKTGKPICLVVYTDWCPHCTNYSRLFHDAEIEKLSRDFVMVRLNQDDDRQITDRYGPDGLYVPRTMFLGADGELDPALKIPRAKYVYFYDEHDPGPLRAALKAARRKLARTAADS